MRALLLATALGGLTFAACGDAPDASAESTYDHRSFEVTDSAGVRLVTAQGTLPVLAIGRPRTPPAAWETGRPDHETWFTAIRSGYLLPEEGAVVADGAKGSVHVLNGRGRVVVTFSPRGDGSLLGGVHAVMPLPPDSILVAHVRDRMVGVYSAEGAFARAFPMPPVGEHNYLPSGVAEGRVVFVPHRPMPWGWSDAPVVTSNLLGAELDTLEMGPRLPSWDPGARGFPEGLPRHGIVRAWPGGFVWAPNTSATAHWYGPDGRLKQVFRERRERHDGSAVSMDLVVGQDGSVWRGGGYPWATPEPWLVVGADGVTAHQVRVPFRFTVLDASGDRVLGVWRDELGIQAVAMLQEGFRPPRFLTETLDWWLER